MKATGKKKVPGKKAKVTKSAAPAKRAKKASPASRRSREIPPIETPDTPPPSLYLNVEENSPAHRQGHRRLNLKENSAQKLSSKGR